VFCPKCGSTNEAGVPSCVNCGEALPQIPRPRDSHDDALGYIIPINVSGWAIAAGYAGLFSVLLVFAPISLVLGIVALRDLERRPQLRGKGRAWFGAVMGGVFSFVLVIVLIGVLSGGGK
jgi:hypothetical protein